MRCQEILNTYFLLDFVCEDFDLRFQIPIPAMMLEYLEEKLCSGLRLRGLYSCINLNEPGRPPRVERFSWVGAAEGAGLGEGPAEVRNLEDFLDSLLTPKLLPLLPPCEVAAFSWHRVL